MIWNQLKSNKIYLLLGTFSCPCKTFLQFPTLLRYDIRHLWVPKLILRLCPEKSISVGLNWQIFLNICNPNRSPGSWRPNIRCSSSLESKHIKNRKYKPMHLKIGPFKKLNHGAFVLISYSWEKIWRNKCWHISIMTSR